MTHVRTQKAEVRNIFLFCVISAFCALTSDLVAAAGPAAQAYNPAWADELSWNNQELINRMTGSYAWVEDLYKPWWQGRVAHPVDDYSPSKLPTGAVRLDSAVDVELLFHRPQPGWSVQSSPTNFNNVYHFTPSSTAREDQTARSGQNAYFNIGAHPIESVSAAIGAEAIGNYDQRFWFPINDEHRMYNDDKHIRIVTGELKYETAPFMIRAFEGVPHYGWTGQNDLFQLLPAQTDVEYYRHVSGTLTPRGGEMRVTSRLGTLTAVGGSEIRWGYGSSAFVKYDVPTFRNLEQSIIYRNENVPFGLQDPDERRWALSYNASYLFSERLVSHAGILYQPFRLSTPFQQPDSANLSDVDTLKQKDALGITLRSEYHPKKIVDLVGLGYTYEGAAAGNKQQVDLDGSRNLSVWVLSLAYQYRQPVIGPVPTRFEGTTANPGAYLSIPRGSDDPFRVNWDSRKEHIASFTLVFNPNQGTPFFKYQRNVLEEWNINPDLKTTWSGAVQYRMVYYPTNTDRTYHYDEIRNIIYDPVSYTNSGARATSSPFSSGTGLLRYQDGLWRTILDISAGEALASGGVAYTPATDFYKPSTVFVSGGLSVQYDWMKAFIRYGQDVWGPIDYHSQLGWTYHKVYQAGLSGQFLRDFEAGFRYIATRMTQEFIGSDTGAFNEYRFYLTYHFSLTRNFEEKFKEVGRPLPKAFPEARVTVSAPFLAPEGAVDSREITVYPKATSDTGILSWKLFAHDAQGKLVRQWDGNGAPQKEVHWNGLGKEGVTVPDGVYRLSLLVVDLYGNETTSPAEEVTVEAAKAPVVPVVAAVPAKDYAVQTTAEGLKVTLSSLVLFDVNKYDLKPTSAKGLQQIVDLLKAYPTNMLRVSGHTDSTGGKALNQELSEMRAKAVVNYLISQGKIDASRLKAVGYGSSRPIATNVTEEGRQLNRRVEIDILK